MFSLSTNWQSDEHHNSGLWKRKTNKSDNMSFRHLVRIKSTDLEGYLPVSLGLSKITGVNRRLAQTIVKTLNIPYSERIGTLTDVKVKEIEGVISK